MLDINLIRNDPEGVKTSLLKRMDSLDFTRLLECDRLRRNLLAESEKLKAERNRVSALIPRLRKEGSNIDTLLSDMKKTGDLIKEHDTTLESIEAEIHSFLESLPNIPAADVLPGGKENNKVVREWGVKPVFTFPPKDHMTLSKSLGLIDYERGAKLGGNGFWIYRGFGAVMEWALLNYFVEEHLKDGYEFILPPHILNYQCGYAAGQFPKFVDDVFHLKQDEGKGSGQFILPTAETALVNIYRDEIIEEANLPLKFFAYTPCYRKEAGSYRAEERGMIRGHQFNKVEMFQYTKPEDSENALEELVGKAESLVKGLGLHYRVSKLAAGDCSASMGKTCDIEVWIPSMNDYKEVSSASNGYEYQSRRGNIRFRRKDSKKNEYVHTLNASGLATSRLLPAIMEHFQHGDGSITIPEVLRKWTGKEILKP
ncbi:MAG: serine--tRNA ligase [Eubacteriales bacterium]|nr:serine--tRNA ligase [Eubacteriales bacterium]